MNKGKYKRPAARASRGGTLLGVFVGLVLGVLISFGVVWYMNKTPLPFRDKGARVERPAGADEAPPQSLPGKPGDKVGEKAADKTGDKPRFEFYKILPGGSESAPAAVPVPAQPASAKPAEAKAAGEPLFLQAGAFQKQADADNLKAKLALMGLDAAIQEVEIADKGKMYRVRTGPFASMEEMNRARGELSQNGIQAAPVKGK
jgi:cell division protein FtsN